MCWRLTCEYAGQKESNKQKKNHINFDTISVVYVVVLPLGNFHEPFLSSAALN